MPYIAAAQHEVDMHETSRSYVHISDDDNTIASSGTCSINPFAAIVHVQSCAITCKRATKYTHCSDSCLLPSCVAHIPNQLVRDAYTCILSMKILLACISTSVRTYTMWHAA